jgi:hypothetical protein
VYKQVQKFKQQQAQLNNVRRVRAKRLKIAEGIFWAISIVSAIYATRKLNNVFVSGWEVASVWVLSGIIVSVFLIKQMKAFWMGVLFSGAVFIAALLLINDMFSVGQPQSFKVPIKRKYHSHSRSGPKVDVEFAEVVNTVRADSDLQVDSSSYVVLNMKRGYLGYYFIIDSKLVK